MEGEGGALFKNGGERKRKGGRETPFLPSLSLLKRRAS